MTAIHPLAHPLRNFNIFVDAWRFRLLLALLLLSIFLQPLINGFSFGPGLMVLIIALIFGGALHATSRSAKFERTGSAATFLWAGIAMASIYMASPMLNLLAIIITIGLVVLVAWGTFAALVTEAKADGDALAGAVFGYFLLAMLWAQLFFALETWQPGSFNVSDHQSARSELLYLSLITITTLGYGDILPVSGMARMLTGIQAAVGTLYIAILIGRIVGALKQPVPPVGAPEAADKSD
jgi:hypothetical protein